MQSRRNLTVGVLYNAYIYQGMFPNRIAAPVIRGIQAAARDQGVNLMVGCGMSHGTVLAPIRPAWPDPIGEVDFVPVGPWNTDGLLVFSPLHIEEQIRYIRRLQDDKFPFLFIGSGLGNPSIIVDNEGGIRQALQHLVGHGHRNIAFLAGDPNDSGDSSARVDAYHRGVQELGLNNDRRLLDYGQHQEDPAFRATQRILESGVKFTAILCSNDASALGAIRALHDAGLRVPWDVAVTGFDDQPEAFTAIPPLTSVRYPLFEMGYRALLLIRKRIEKGPGAIPDVIRVFTQLMTRQSCGCLPQMDHPSLAVYEATMTADRQDPARYREDLGQAMMESLISNNASDNIPDVQKLCDRLIDAFLQSLQDEDLSHFQIALIDILQRIEILEEDAHAWQSAISVLRLCTRVPLANRIGPQNLRLAEDLLHQARALISDSARRRLTRLQLQQTYHDEVLSRLTTRLLSSLEEEQIYSTLADSLPQVGIRSCHVMLFEPRGGDPFGGSILSPRGKDFPGLRFETRKFPPPEIYAGSESFNLAIIPLFFQQENLGYAAFDGENLDLLAMVVIQLAAAIQCAQLHGKVRELSLTDNLTEVHNRRYFEILLEEEVGRCRRYSRDLAMIMVDIDWFKRYNDAFGHLAGDEALREIARCILEGARRGLDVVTRYGGEEFAVILPETNAEGARIVAEKIRQKIQLPGHFLRRLTASLGITAMHGDQLDLKKLMEQSDRALFEAKRQGRDRAVLFEEWMQDSAHPQKADG